MSKSSRRRRRKESRQGIAFLRPHLRLSLPNHIQFTPLVHLPGSAEVQLPPNQPSFSLHQLYPTCSVLRSPSFGLRLPPCLARPLHLSSGTLLLSFPREYPLDRHQSFLPVFLSPKSLLNPSSHSSLFSSPQTKSALPSLVSKAFSRSKSRNLMATTKTGWENTRETVVSSSSQRLPRRSLMLYVPLETFGDQPDGLLPSCPLADVPFHVTAQILQRQQHRSLPTRWQHWSRRRLGTSLRRAHPQPFWLEPNSTVRRRFGSVARYLIMSQQSHKLTLVYAQQVSSPSTLDVYLKYSTTKSGRRVT